jgi:hypothetical protein
MRGDCCAAGFQSGLCRLGVRFGLSAMSVQCPFCPKADMTGALKKVAIAWESVVLYFSDKALARILIAGTAVEPNWQSAWLEDLAARLERASELSPGARYTRAWRARERAGRCLLRLEVDEAELVVALVDRGLLDPAKADNRMALTRAAERALTQLCRETSRPSEADLDTIRVGLCLATLQPREPPSWPTNEDSGKR